MSEVVADVRGSGPPVVLLHGQPGSASEWEPVSERLAIDFTVIVPDRPGYGRTGGRARGIRANGAAVRALLDDLHLPSAIVVGHSWAGAIAIALAEDSPSRLTGMVLLASVGPGEPLTRFDRMLAVPPIGTAFMAGSLHVAGRVLSLPPARQLIERRNGNSHAVTAMVESWRTGRVWRSFVTEQRSLIDELPGLADRLATIHTPTVVMVGNLDRIVPPETGRRLAEAIPGARLRRLPGAGHLLAHQRPDAIVAEIRRLSGADGGPV